MAEKETKAVTLASASKAEVIPGYGSASGFDLLQRGAQALAASSMVPVAYGGQRRELRRGARNVTANEGDRPLMVMQNLHVIHGKPSWSSAFLIGALNGSPRYTADTSSAYVRREGQRFTHVRGDHDRQGDGRGDRRP